MTFNYGTEWRRGLCAAQCTNILTLRNKRAEPRAAICPKNIWGEAANMCKAQCQGAGCSMKFTFHFISYLSGHRGQDNWHLQIMTAWTPGRKNNINENHIVAVEDNCSLGTQDNIWTSGFCPHYYFTLVLSPNNWRLFSCCRSRFGIVRIFLCYIKGWLVQSLSGFRH